MGGGDLATALGGMREGVSPLVMAQAYSAFADQGVLHETHAIREIRDDEGNIVYAHLAAGTPMMTEGTARDMTAMLRQVVERGTGRGAQLPVWAAGKTGTTQLDMEGAPEGANRDLWFAGYTAELTAAVWLGYDVNGSDYLQEGSGAAARLFANIAGPM
ncbi:penicillin-binding transpeptidase domain-containing protein [Paenibacillus sp. 1P07SE]|uniref:penicillin-binding transpeptidase domain-containing protein n=1 Tax=Paenibacillus sp. 1P07SE TaxID=3132209 RepID=UPI0039A42A56